MESERAENLTARFIGIYMQNIPPYDLSAFIWFALWCVQLIYINNGIAGHVVFLLRLCRHYLDPRSQAHCIDEDQNYPHVSCLSQTPVSGLPIHFHAMPFGFLENTTDVDVPPLRKRMHIVVCGMRILFVLFGPEISPVRLFK